MTRLIQLMNDMVVREGSQGRMRMALAIDRGERMVRRYLNGESIPSQKTAYRLALACGCTDEEALAVARECSSGGDRESA